MSRMCRVARLKRLLNSLFLVFGEIAEETRASSRGGVRWDPTARRARPATADSRAASRTGDRRPTRRGPRRLRAALDELSGQPGPQIEGQRKFARHVRGRRRHDPRAVPVLLEARLATRLGLIRVDRECIIVAPAGMGDMVDAAAQRSVVRAIDDVEGQRRVDRQGRVQAAGQLPSLVANAGDGLHRHAGRGHRQRRGRCR